MIFTICQDLTLSGFDIYYLSGSDTGECVNNTYSLSAFGYLSGVPLLSLSDTSAKPVYLSFVILKQPLCTLPHAGRKDIGTRYKRRGLGEASAEDDKYDDDGDERCRLIVATTL